MTTRPDQPTPAASIAPGPASDALGRDLDALTDLLAAGRVLVLSGAGLSTESGIPDYRGPDGTRRVQPMTYQAFVVDPDARRRFWARSYVGWQRFRSARPNAGHRAVARLQGLGVVERVITQNVDGLHQRAGSTDVIELHGNLARVRCVTCGDRTSRDVVQERLLVANPRLGRLGEAARLLPDGDVALPDDVAADLVLARCLVCDGDLLKPDVVFFGESVPRETVQRCFELTEGAGSLLVLGSSLAVMSGYRFVRRAHAVGVPVAIVTHGATRGDGQADIRVDAPLGPTLTTLVARLTSRTRH